MLNVHYFLLKMTSFGNNRGLFSAILDEARGMAMEAHSGKTIMYTVVGVDWRPFGHPRQRRPLNSVVLDDGVGERLVTDVKDFIQVTQSVVVQNGVFADLQASWNYKNSAALN